MSISKQLITYVESLQEQADRSYQQYPKYQTILPNDAIYLVRLANLKAVCDIIEKGCTEYNKSIAEVLKLAIIPALPEINKAYPYVSEALNAIIEKYAPERGVA